MSSSTRSHRKRKQQAHDPKETDPMLSYPSEIILPSSNGDDSPENNDILLESKESKIENHDDKEHHSAPNLKGDYGSVSVLVFLYILQGIPLGLAGSIPLILQNRNVSYAQQAVFSLVNWPFSVKLLWAPIVDSLFWARFGRRKSWLVPVQYAIGLAMLLVSFHIDDLIGGSEAVLFNSTHPINGTSENMDANNQFPLPAPRIQMLTAVFLFINFLCATQDIAVDGWALTMLSRRNVIYASTCNTVGQNAGFFLGNVVFLAFESPEFCNKYFRSVPQAEGLITLPGFVYFWGLVFIITTTFIMLFKTDKEHSADERDLRVIQTYKMLYKILQLPAVRTFALLLLTCKIGFAVTDAASGLKLIEAKLLKENIALMAIPMVPIEIILPWIVSKYTKGTGSLTIFLKAYPYRLFFGIIFAMIVKWTFVARLVDGSFPMHYYGVLLLAFAIHQVTMYCMFVSLMSFHARVSDPAIGGTYMTLLNTLTNLGGNWPATLSLGLLDFFTIRVCYKQAKEYLSCAFCFNQIGDKCETYIDGYYIETAICVLVGYIWLRVCSKSLLNLQSLPLSAWKCK